MTETTPAPSLPAWRTDPGGYVLAVCTERELRARSVGGAAPWTVWQRHGRDFADEAFSEVTVQDGHNAAVLDVWPYEPYPVMDADGPECAAHIAAEADPDTVLADVKLWRDLVKVWATLDGHTRNYLLTAARRYMRQTEEG